MGKQKTEYTDFAWDGVAFKVPRTWNPSYFNLRKRNAVLTFDDDFSSRMEIEWVRPRRARDISRLKKRYDAGARKYNQDARETTEIREPGRGWVGAVYAMSENLRLATAMYLDPEDRLFAYLIVHFDPRDPEDPQNLLETLTRSFGLITADIRPWRLYDIDMRLPAAFRLADTEFETGKKLLMFQNQGRRLFIWHIALADIMLKKHPIEIWVRDVLNVCRRIRGPRFYVDMDNQVRYRRAWWKRSGHYTEVLRGCRAYQIEYRHDKEKNRIIIQVFNFRKEDDQGMLEGLEIL